MENYEPVRVFEVRSSHSELLWKTGPVAFTNMVHVGIITLGKIIEKKTVTKFSFGKISSF